MTDIVKYQMFREYTYIMVHFGPDDTYKGDPKYNTVLSREIVMSSRCYKSNTVMILCRYSILYMNITTHIVC